MSVKVNKLKVIYYTFQDHSWKIHNFRHIQRPDRQKQTDSETGIENRKNSQSQKVSQKACIEGHPQERKNSHQKQGHQVQGERQDLQGKDKQERHRQGNRQKISHQKAQSGQKIYNKSKLLERCCKINFKSQTLEIQSLTHIFFKIKKSNREG